MKKVKNQYEFTLRKFNYICFLLLQVAKNQVSFLDLAVVEKY